MTTTVDMGTLIVSTPGTCRGCPRFAKTRITLKNIAIDFNAGLTPEQIIDKKPHLTLHEFMVNYPTLLRTKTKLTRL
jgi:uncharacterized protein (DUF433 family)